MHSGLTWARLGLGLAALSCFFARVTTVNAQVPVITNPSDEHYLNINSAFDPLNPDAGWTPLAPMPTARAGFAISAAGGLIYAIGGAVVDTCTTVSTNEAYDPVADTWNPDGLAPAPMPAPLRWRPSAGTLDGTIYVVGGASVDGDSCGDALGIVQAYDPSTNSWSDKMPLPTLRIQVGVGVDPDNHLLYAVGGANPDFTALDTVEVYDPAMDMWTTLKPLNTPRAFPAVAAIGGKIYAAGGQKELYGTVNTVEEYDPANPDAGWTLKSSVMPLPRLNSGAAVVNDKIYIVGGELQFGSLSTVEIYDPAQNPPDDWTMGVSMPTSRSFPGVTEMDGILYAMGGEALMATVGQQFIYQITATNNPFTYDASPLPDGLFVDRTQGIIYGTPLDPVRAFPVTLTAKNRSGFSLPKVVSLYIGKPSLTLPAIVSTSCATGRVGQPFAFQVLTNNASSLAQLTATGLPYLEGGAPPELTLDPGTGIISGTVTQIDGTAESFGVTLNLTDGSATASSFLELTFVSPESELPVITSTSSATLVLNQFFSYTINADQAANIFDYIGLDGLFAGSLPPGLAFDSATGTISGTYYGGTTVSSGPGRSPMPSPATDHSAEGSVEGPDTIKKPPPLIQLLTTTPGAGTGTAPLNFTIGLRDFEVEALNDTTSPGTDYTIFTDDPHTSGGAAGLLKSTEVGDYVEYTVPVALAGTYDVNVALKTNKGKGKFQLSIDDVNQGQPYDEYSSTVGYAVADLGPITFTSTGDKHFQFQVTDKNPLSAGYELVFDAIDLNPYFEAENLFVQAHTAPYVIIRDPSLSGGRGGLLGGTQAGDYLTYTVPIAVAGTYNIRAGVKNNDDKGIFQLAIDGLNQGYAQDEYSPTITYGFRDLGTYNFAAPGDYAFQFLVTGHNSNSSSYELVVDYLDLILTSHFEAELLAPKRHLGKLQRLIDGNFSGGKGTLLDAKSAGQFVTYTVTIPVAGSYDVKVGTKTSNNGGIFQLLIDRANQGVSDEYSAEVGYAVVDLGRITFSEAGDHEFKFLVTGRNSNSSGYQFVFDYLDLSR